MKTNQQLLSCVEYRISELRKKLVLVEHPDSQYDFLVRAEITARLDELEMLVSFNNENIV